ncbi:hypothetical protein HanRHA438_Chr12g0560241 [Helianthus annuus]|nr:hypothetical protein HanRHA438_Chr12g0560241 [Helianthus annuus]
MIYPTTLLDFLSKCLLLKITAFLISQMFQQVAAATVYTARFSFFPPL